METAVRLIGAVPLALALAGLVGWLLRTRPSLRIRRRGGSGSADLQLELASTVSEIERAVGERGDPRRANALKRLYVDGFFVPVYWALFVSLGVLLAVRDEETTWTSWPLWVGLAAIAAATLTASFDILENAWLRTILRKPLAQTTSAEVRAVRTASLLKWAGMAVTLALLSALFSPDGRTILVYVFGIAFVLLAWVTVVGVLWHRALGWAFRGTLLLAVLLLVYFAFWPDSFLDGYRL